jgi:transposase-like protein
MPDQINGTKCPRCRRPQSVRYEKVIRGKDAFVYYQCDTCRYSWQVRDTDNRPATEPPASSPHAHADDK